MIQLVLDDTLIKEYLFPFTLTRASADIRIGILTIREKWERLLGQKVRVNGDEYLDSPAEQAAATPVVFSGNIVPSRLFIEALLKGEHTGEDILQQPFVRVLQHPWQIFEYNAWALEEDFRLITEKRT